MAGLKTCFFLGELVKNKTFTNSKKIKKFKKVLTNPVEML